MPNLGEFETLIILAILRLEHDACGVSILRELQERARRDASPGAIYTALARLETKGLVRVADRVSNDGGAGRPRKYYELTAEAAGAALEGFRQVSVMVDGQVDRLRALASDG
jgi:DNA-binding PadR family transcriptional regulator